MKKALLIWTFLLSISTVKGQMINLDSLTQIVLQQSSKFKPLATPNRDSILNQIPLSKSSSDRIKMMYDIILNSGELNSKAALYYHHKILDLSRKNNDQVSESVILSELGYTITKNGDQQEGIKIILDGLKLAQKTGNNQAIGICFDNLGVCSTNNYIKKVSFLKAIYYSHAGHDDLFECFAISNLIPVLWQENKQDSAKIYFTRGFKLAIGKNLQQVLPGLFNNLAVIQTTPPYKLKYYNLALKLPFIKIDPRVKTDILSNIANIYLQERKIDSSLYYAKKAYQTAITGLFIYRITPAQLLESIYKGINADSALIYADIFYSAKDSAYNIRKSETAQAMAFSYQLRDQQAAAQKLLYQTNLRTYLLTSIIVFFVVLAFVFWRNNKLSNIAKAKIEQTLSELKATQTQLIQSEKMASLGELTAGIAHEIQNPLNFVNNFSEVSKELLEELKDELDKGDIEEAKIISDDVIQNLDKINHHGKRADAIVKGMLEHSRAGSGAKEPTDINKLADEYLRLSYHGLRAKDKSFNATLITNFDENLPLINVIPQDIGRVFLNLFNNAFYAVNQKAKIADLVYQLEVSVTTLAQNGKVIIKVKDNGIGIPDAIKDKIMQPFFTTKPTGEGTGLGLSLTYDMVVKGHGGKIEVNSTVGEGSEFIVTLSLI